ncbi:MAG: hypothetical protein ABSD46_04485 [Bacteroidota bacterium]
MEKRPNGRLKGKTSWGRLYKNRGYNDNNRDEEEGGGRVKENPRRGASRCAQKQDTTCCVPTEAKIIAAASVCRG